VAGTISSGSSLTTTSEDSFISASLKASSLTLVAWSAYLVKLDFIEPLTDPFFLPILFLELLF
jgi:hypothetical protein